MMPQYKNIEFCSQVINVFIWYHFKGEKKKDENKSHPKKVSFPNHLTLEFHDVQRKLRKLSES